MWSDVMVVVQSTKKDVKKKTKSSASKSVKTTDVSATQHSEQSDHKLDQSDHKSDRERSRRRLSPRGDAENEQQLDHADHLDQQVDHGDSEPSECLSLPAALPSIHADTISPRHSDADTGRSRRTEGARRRRHLSVGDAETSDVDRDSGRRTDESTRAGTTAFLLTGPLPPLNTTSMNLHFILVLVVVVVVVVSFPFPSHIPCSPPLRSRTPTSGEGAVSTVNSPSGVLSRAPPKIEFGAS